MMNIDEQKKEIRKSIKALKKEVSLDEKKRRSIKILESLENNEVFKNAETLMLYWSMDDEVYTHDFVLKWWERKKIILPCVNGDLLELRVFKGLDNLVEGDGFAILEPSGELFTEIESIDLIIVPGVAFDKANNRMGRGKAYYDKLLITTTCKKIGICFDFQLLDSVPVNEYDVMMDRIITE
jgi:5-formyltetrahydrofolate cyclo-ligase